MSQNLNPPAYQEWAATMLAQLPFRTMSLQDRGLFYTMRLECWVNKQLPNDLETLAKVFGLPLDQVSASMPAVMPFFKVEGDFIICPQLEDYRAHLEVRRVTLSKAGKKGAKITNNSKKKPNDSISNEVTATPTATPQPPRRPRVGLLVQSNTVKQSQIQSSKEKDSSADSFVKEMEEYEATEENGNKEFVRF